MRRRTIVASLVVLLCALFGLAIAAQPPDPGAAGPGLAFLHRLRASRQAARERAAATRSRAVLAASPLGPWALSGPGYRGEADIDTRSGKIRLFLTRRAPSGGEAEIRLAGHWRPPDLQLKGSVARVDGDGAFHAPIVGTPITAEFRLSPDGTTFSGNWRSPNGQGGSERLMRELPGLPPAAIERAPGERLIADLQRHAVGWPFLIPGARPGPATEPPAFVDALGRLLPHDTTPLGDPHIERPGLRVTLQPASGRSLDLDALEAAVLLARRDPLEILIADLARWDPRHPLTQRLTRSGWAVEGRIAYLAGRVLEDEGILREALEAALREVPRVP